MGAAGAAASREGQVTRAGPEVRTDRSCTLKSCPCWQPWELMLPRSSAKYGGGAGQVRRLDGALAQLILGQRGPVTVNVSASS